MFKNYTSKKDFENIMKAMAYIKPYRLIYLGFIVLTLIYLAVQLYQPMLLGKVTTSFIDKRFDNLLRLVIIVCSLRLIEVMINFTKSYALAILNNNIILDINYKLIEKILNLEIRTFDNVRTGDIVSKISGDTAIVSNVITNQLVNTVFDVIRVLVIGVIIFRINPILSCVALLFLPFSFLVFVVFSKKIRSRNVIIRKKNDDYFSLLFQTLSAIREVKALGLKEELYDRIIAQARSIKENNIKFNSITELSRGTSQIINYIIGMVILCLSGYLLYKQKLDIGSFVAFTAYSSQFTESLKRITQLSSSIQVLFTSCERIFSILDGAEYKNERFGNTNSTHLKGDIKFVNVQFGYKKDCEILKDISMHIKANKMTAIVGRSGVGKSTIFNLILKLYDIDKGQITIDNTNIDDLSEQSIRTNLSIVRQEPYLFNISIIDNIRLVKKDSSDEEVIKACKDAYIYDFIMSLPNKYNTIVGENGVSLSSGQRQRLAIARALLKNASIILFDEATSSLDNESQQYIKKAINKIANYKTVIVIAHRLSTIVDASEIFVISDGKVVGQGNHTDLISSNTIYKKLYESEIDKSYEAESQVS